MPAASFGVVREPSARTLCDLPAQRGRVDEVDESPSAVDLHDRQPLAVRRLERVVPADVDLLECLPELGAQHVARPLAELATLRVEEDDPRDRCRG